MYILDYIVMQMRKTNREKGYSAGKFLVLRCRWLMSNPAMGLTVQSLDQYFHWTDLALVQQHLFSSIPEAVIVDVAAHI